MYIDYYRINILLFACVSLILSNVIDGSGNQWMFFFLQFGSLLIFVCFQLHSINVALQKLIASKYHMLLSYQYNGWGYET